MDTSTPQHFTIMYPTAGQHTLTTHSHQIHASMSESSWPLNHHSSSNTSSPSAQASSMFSIVNRAADFDYPSPAASAASPSYIHHHQQENFTGLHQSPSLSSDSSNDVMASPFNQVESSIGPNRVLTRRQRAALEQSSPGRRVSAPSIFSRTEQDHSPVCSFHFILWYIRIILIFKIRLNYSAAPLCYVSQSANGGVSPTDAYKCVRIKSLSATA